MSKGFLTLLAAIVLLFLSAPMADAFDGRSKVTRQTQEKQGVQFKVKFFRSDELVTVHLVAPRQVSNLPLAGFELLLVENDKTTLRVQLAGSHWVGTEIDKEGLTLQQLMLNPEISFLVSQENLPKCVLNVRYGTGDYGWTYEVDVASYRSSPRDKEDE